MCAAFRCSIKQANCQLAIQQKQQETLYDKHTHLSHRQPWNKVWDTGISVLSMAACVCSHLLVVLFTFMRVNNVFVCVCVCLATCRDGNYCDMMGPQRDGVLHFILSLSLNHVFSSSHNRVRSLLRSPSFFVFLHFFFFFFITAELNELVSYSAREWSRLACASWLKASWNPPLIRWVWVTSLHSNPPSKNTNKIWQELHSHFKCEVERFLTSLIFTDIL